MLTAPIEGFKAVSAAPDPTFRYSKMVLEGTDTDVMERDKARGTGSLPFLVLPP